MSDLNIGDLVWLSEKDYDFAPLALDSEQRASDMFKESIEPGTVMMIMRRPKTKDFSSWLRKTSYVQGRTYAGHFSTISWVVLCNNRPWIVAERRLSKRWLKES